MLDGFAELVQFAFKSSNYLISDTGRKSALFVWLCPVWFYCYFWVVQTARIRFQDLANTYKDLVSYLAMRWGAAELSPEWYWEGERLAEPIRYLYLDYLQSIGTLLLTTQDPNQTQIICISVLHQAQALDRSSFWV